MRKVLVGVLGLVAVCLGVFGAPRTALWLMVGAGLLLLPDTRRWGRRGLLLLWLLLGLWRWQTPLVEYADRTRALLDAPTWSVRDKAGVWILNVGMALGGALVGCPEAAVETLLLILPAPADGVRTFRSDFPAGSAKVQEALAGWRRANPQGRAGLLPEQRVAWVYARTGLREARYALALNAITLRGEVIQADDGAARLSVCGTVAVSYWPTTSIPLMSVQGRTVALEEGLYWRLQQEGWLSPYDAVWCWEEPW